MHQARVQMIIWCEAPKKDFLENPGFPLGFSTHLII
jgi:hypothetical protein